MCYQTQKLPNPENIVSRKSESAISSKIVINFYIVIRFGECGYLVLTIDHSIVTRFVFIIAALSILAQLFQSAIMTMSAMDLDFFDSEVEAQMDEEQKEEEGRSQSVELEEVVGDNEAIFQLERI